MQVISAKVSPMWGRALPLKGPCIGTQPEGERDVCEKTVLGAETSSDGVVVDDVVQLFAEIRFGWHEQ